GRVLTHAAEPRLAALALEQLLDDGLGHEAPEDRARAAAVGDGQQRGGRDGADRADDQARDRRRDREDDARVEGDLAHDQPQRESAGPVPGGPWKSTSAPRRPPTPGPGTWRPRAASAAATANDDSPLTTYGTRRIWPPTAVGSRLLAARAKAGPRFASPPSTS